MVNLGIDPLSISNRCVTRSGGLDTDAVQWIDFMEEIGRDLEPLKAYIFVSIKRKILKACSLGYLYDFLQKTLLKI